MRSDRVWRLAAPFLIAFVAFFSAVIAEGAVTFVLVRNPIAFWLMRHETVANAIALTQFASFAASSAIAVYFVVSILAPRERASGSLSAHIRHSAFLYVVFIGAVVAHVRCFNYCEGLVLGSIKFFALLALGGIVADGWALRRQGSVAAV